MQAVAAEKEKTKALEKEFGITCHAQVIREIG